jgi:HD superfamily phosphohydrolase
LHKIINDPVHGFITINDALVMQVISHPYYQRLRRIKQMALAYLVYPGAVHTRFQHSLGAYHLMCKALDELKLKGFEINAQEMQAAKIAILLHDIGHGPFSHALEESLVNVKHEEISLLIMQALNTQMNGALQLAIDIFLGNNSKPFLHQLVSSQLDVDRLDYLARDSFFTGVSEGVIGYDRIIKMLTVQNNELAVEEKGIHSIEKFLIARRLMYWQVYLHKTVLSSEQMLVKILHRVKQIHTKENPIFSSPSLQFFLENNITIQDFKTNKDCLIHFTRLDDYDLLGAIKVWANHSDKILSDLSTRLINRNLFKTIFSNQNNKTQKDQIQQAVTNKFALNVAEIKYYIIDDSTSNMAYDIHNEHINIVFKNGEIKDIAEIEDALIASNVGKTIKKYYICYPKFD